MDNIIVEYYYDYFDLNFKYVGIIVLVFGLMNIFICFGGGIFFDVVL